MSKFKQKMHFKCRPSTPCARGCGKAAFVLPLILIALGTLTRWVSGSPLPTLHYVGARDLLPPIWLIVLLFCISYAVAGLALGLVLGTRAPCGERRYQGAMYFVISLALGYAWYPLFFAARVFLVASAAGVLCLIFSVLASFCFAYVRRTAFFLSLIYDAWLIYLTLLNIKIIFTL